jgi:hypothetical protein
MKQNIHNVERAIRVIVGLAIIPLATGVIGWCPPYALFGISTCKKPE